MRFSAKTRYGLLALMDMALHQETGGGARLTTKEIATHQGIPERFLEQQITVLKNAGLVISHRGAAGGCSLARRAEDITVLEVIEALEGPPWPWSGPRVPRARRWAARCGSCGRRRSRR